MGQGGNWQNPGDGQGGEPAVPPGWQQGQGNPGQQPPGGQYLPPWPPQGQQPYQGPPQYGPPPQQAPRRRGRAGRILGLGCGGLGALVVLVAVLASHGGTSSSAPPAVPTVAVSQAAAPAGSTAAAAQTVTYVVTGSPADVTYGPTGTELAGTVPMNKTAAIPPKPPLYYSVSAQLQGSGTVSCEIKISGKVISSSTASGGYQIASCEVSRDPFTGEWQDTNSG